MPEEILGGGFVDYDTNTCINAMLQNLNLDSTKPPPRMSLGISWNEQFQTIYWGGDLVNYSTLHRYFKPSSDIYETICILKFLPFLASCIMGAKCRWDPPRGAHGPTQEPQGQSRGWPDIRGDHSRPQSHGWKAFAQRTLWSCYWKSQKGKCRWYCWASFAR